MSARIGVLERNFASGQRIARVVGAAASLAEVAVAEDPSELRAALSPETTLLCCDVAELDLVLGWCDAYFPRARVLTWSNTPESAFKRALTDPRVANIVAWAPFHSIPRPWELAMVARRLTDGAAPKVVDLLNWGATSVKWQPLETNDRDRAVEELRALTERLGIAGRLGDRVTDVAYEMLMNAMYDAPRAVDGTARFAHDRRAQISLAPSEAPTLRFATDGLLAGLEISDPFGRLTRQHVLDGILRGRAAVGVERATDALDTSGGGAGLGLFRIYQASAVTVVDVKPNVLTRVSAFFELDVSPRDLRVMPTSLHFFEPHAAEGSR